MKLPVTLSILLAAIALAVTIWVTDQDIDLANKITITTYIFTASGGLISAVFLIYGYFINLSVFRESQKPRLLLQINNDRRILEIEKTKKDVHQTIVRYANLSQNECRGLNLKLSLMRDNEVIEIPRLFSPDMNMGPNDSRTRDFPTLSYLSMHGIPEAVVQNLNQYTLRASYSYKLMDEEISSHYDYKWDQKKERWSIV